MDFKQPRNILIIRVVVLTLSLLLMVNAFYTDSFAISQLFFVLLVVFQIISMIRFQEKQNREITDFLHSIEFNDFSFNYHAKDGSENLSVLKSEFNKVLKKLREINLEKEEEFQYMKNIVSHVGIGLITFDASGKVQIINTAAKKLLKIQNLKKLEELNALSPALVESFQRLKTGGRDLVRLEINGDIIQLAIYAIQLSLRGNEFKLVSIQNIQSELEEKEMEAWQNLVRVLTHEIMNSITPITSLATTVDESLNEYEKKGEQVEIGIEDLEDIHLAIRTIMKRGAGLVRFVQDFRNLTHIPQPRISEISAKELLHETSTLMQKEIKDNNINLTIEIEPSNLIINADKELITQVLINILKNAVQAFDEQKERKIEVNAYYSDKSSPIISIKDNGSGIDEDALEKIFIPFFTTKKSGSGIGLSLSRQIMRQHKGALGVKTRMKEGTEFILKF